MKQRGYWGSFCLVTAALFGFCLAASAEESPQGAAYFNGALRKLGRGIANIATCPGEIPRTASLVGRDSGVIAESSVGVVKGVGRTLLRGVTGAFEVVTFFVDIPAGFEPIMKPEFVWADNSWQE